MVELLVLLVVALLAVAIVWWVIQKIPLPAPFTWIGAAVIGLVALLLLLWFAQRLLHTGLP
jgi:uncharacterized membrane protein YwzB